MEVYILDSLLRRNQVVDNFESLIWTERWSERGDFELDLKSTLENRTRFLPGTHLAINNSYRVMTVESVEDKITDEGKETFLVKGRSLEAILKDRAAMKNLTGEKWFITGTPANVARYMFDYICRPTPALSALDLIPFLQPGSIFPIGTMPESETPIQWEQPPESLYAAIQKVCQLYGLGFRLVRNFDESELYFDIYAGNNRTTKQTDLTPVVFSVGLDNIQNTTEFASIMQAKNVAYVYSNQGNTVVYGENVDPTVDGFDRRIVVVNAQIEEGEPNPGAVLIQAGEEALYSNKAETIFDGEINQRTRYMYGVDYDLGDVVEMRNKDGVVTYKRVTEQIFVADSNGERSYPTLAFDMEAGLNTWLSWINKSDAWEDFDTEVWADV